MSSVEWRAAFWGSVRGVQYLSVRSPSASSPSSAGGCGVKWWSSQKRSPEWSIALATCYRAKAGGSRGGEGRKVCWRWKGGCGEWVINRGSDVCPGGRALKRPFRDAVQTVWSKARRCRGMAGGPSEAAGQVRADCRHRRRSEGGVRGGESQSGGGGCVRACAGV